MCCHNWQKVLKFKHLGLIYCIKAALDSNLECLELYAFVVIRFLTFSIARWWHTGFLQLSKVCVTRRVVFSFSCNEIMRECESYNTVIGFVFSALFYFLFSLLKIACTKILCLLAFVFLGLIHLSSGRRALLELELDVRLAFNYLSSVSYV